MFPERAQIKARQTNRANSLVFCEKATGIAQFGAASDDNLDFALERAAGLLAMQCMARGTEPADFAILAPVERMLADRLIARAEELLAQGRSASSASQLSPRQHQVLQSVISNRENKEIASRLNITVRTVKFHISTLLDKFGVDNRTDLARRAATMMRSAVLADDSVNSTAEPARARPRQLNSVPMQGGVPASRKDRSIRFPGRAIGA